MKIGVFKTVLRGDKYNFIESDENRSTICYPKYSSGNKQLQKFT